MLTNFQHFITMLTWMYLNINSLTLTLNVRGQSYLGLIRSMSWLLMPWLHASPGHQHQWYWLRRMGKFVSYLRTDFNYMCHVNVEEWYKMQRYVLFPLKDLARKGLTQTPTSFLKQTCSGGSDLHAVWPGTARVVQVVHGVEADGHGCPLVHFELIEERQSEN